MLSLFEKPNILLRLEGLAVFFLALAIYWQQAYSWPLFWSTILLPDIAMLGYLVNTVVGARLYNLTHAKLLPTVLALYALASTQPLYIALALIWFVHIGFDRMLGYGLKYPQGFKLTHLGTLGQVSEDSPHRTFLPCAK